MKREGTKPSLFFLFLNTCTANASKDLAMIWLTNLADPVLTSSAITLKGPMPSQ